MAPWRSLRDASLEELLHLQRPVCGTQRHFDSSSSSEAGDEARSMPLLLRSGRGVGEAESVARSLGRSNARLERWSSSSESGEEEAAPAVVPAPAPAAVPVPVPVPAPAPPFPRPVAPTLVSASVQTQAHSTGAHDLAVLKESLAALLRSAAAAAAAHVHPPPPAQPAAALSPPQRVPLQAAQTPVLRREEVVLSRTAQLARALPPPTRTPALPRTHAPAEASGLLQSEVVAREFAVWAAEQSTTVSPGRVMRSTPPRDSEVDASQMHLDLAALRDMRALLTQHAPRLRSLNLQ